MKILIELEVEPSPDLPDFLLDLRGAIKQTVHNWRNMCPAKITAIRQRAAQEHIEVQKHE